MHRRSRRSTCRWLALALLLTSLVYSDEAQAQSSPSSGTPAAGGSSSGGAAPSTSAPAQPSGSSSRSRLTSRTNRQSTRSDFSSLSRVPYMMGDARLGSKDSIQVRDLAAFDLQHPISNANRLNIAENESPVLADRIFADYRHFENVGTLQFPGIAPGVVRSVSVDSWTLGLEKRVTEFGSIEFRLPLNYQLSSRLDVSQIAPANGLAVTQLPLSDKDTSLGNLAVIFKQAWLETDTLYVTSGAGVNAPTAPDVSVRTTINNPTFVPGPNGGIPYQLQLTSRMNNDTVSLTPFLSAAWLPNENNYGLGFLQLDVPLNESQVSAVGTSSFGGQVPTTINLQGQLAQQVILRANLGAGHWLWKSDFERLINSLGLQSEMHYSTTLNDADQVALNVNPNLAGRSSQPVFGNAANRIDTLNVTLGVQAIMGMTLVTHSFIVPVKNDFDRGYDFEYALIVNRRF